MATPAGGWYRESPARSPVTRARSVVEVGARLPVVLLAPAAQGGSIAVPRGIHASGSYRLGEGVDDGIRITASGVLLNGLGQRVPGSRESWSVRLSVVGPATNVMVANLTLENWMVGIEYRELILVPNVAVNASNSTGNGIFVDRCRDLESRDDVAARNGCPGIAINGSAACRVIHSNASANGDVEVRLTGSEGCTGEAFVAAGNRLNGIYLEGTRVCRLSGCRVCGNGYPDVAFNTSRNVAIRCNLLSGNRLAGHLAGRLGALRGGGERGEGGRKRSLCAKPDRFFKNRRQPLVRAATRRRQRARVHRAAPVLRRGPCDGAPC